MFYNFLKYIYIKTNYGGNRGKKTLLSKSKILKGGAGGDSGKVFVFFDKSLKNINYYRHNNSFLQKKGGDGRSFLKSGKNGKNIVLRMPLKCYILKKNSKKVINIKKGKKVLLIKEKRGKGLYTFKKKKNIFYNKKNFKHTIILFHRKLFHFIFAGFFLLNKNFFLENLLNIKKNNKLNIFFIFNNLEYHKKEIKLFYKYGMFKIFFFFLSFNFKTILINFKILNTKFYKLCKKIFYKPRFLIINKIELLKKIYFKNIKFYLIFKNIFDWNNFIFFNIKFLKKNFLNILKKFIKKI